VSQTVEPSINKTNLAETIKKELLTCSSIKKEMNSKTLAKEAILEGETGSPLIQINKY